MPTLIALIDDADHARPRLAELACAHPGARWVLVACAPRMTHRVSKWVSHSAREHWRDKWAEKLFFQVVATLRSHGAPVQTVVARGSASELTQALQHEHNAEVIDLRKPRAPGSFGADQAASQGRVDLRWLTAISLGWLALAHE